MADYVSYPVIIETTQQHIVWVEAGSHQRAVERLASWPYDAIKDSETLHESGLSIRAPKDQWDWEDVYSDSYDGPYTTEADAHVQTHQHEMFRRKRTAEKAACVAAGHPDRETYASGRVHCKTCWEDLDVAQAGAEK